jgi:hypothetical protein
VPIPSGQGSTPALFLGERHQLLHSRTAANISEKTSGRKGSQCPLTRLQKHKTRGFLMPRPGCSPTVPALKSHSAATLDLQEKRCRSAQRNTELCCWCPQYNGNFPCHLLFPVNLTPQEMGAFSSTRTSYPLLDSIQPPISAAEYRVVLEKSGITSQPASF